MLTNDDELLIEIALREDFGVAGDLSGDITTSATVPKDAHALARIISREPLVVCGHEIAARVFAKLSGDITYTIESADGTAIPENGVLARIEGPFAVILSGERLALNFLQRFSGIASQTRRLTERVKHLPVKLLDTRKTTPGLRRQEKLAVVTGGGKNHRMGLFDQVLIKNNHVDFLNGDIAAAVRLCRESVQPGTVVQVEVRDQLELRNTLSAKPDSLLLDNMSPPELRSCLELLESLGVRKSLSVEASGGITEDNLVAYAETGVDFISLGALTHSVRAADISLRFASR